MFFILCVFAAAFSIESIGTYMSVIGLAAIFSANPIIMAMAVILDFGKLTVVSFLYKKWKKMNFVMRSYMLIASIVLMTITSAGAFGYLSSEFQKAVIPNKESTIKLQTLTEEQTRLQARKQEIDKQVADIPATGVKNRIRLIYNFRDETKRINDRLAVIDTQMPQVKIDAVNVSAHTGPIAYVATAFNISMEEAVKYVILLIIFVFDPLAISLILAGNFLIEERGNKKESVNPVKAPYPESLIEDIDDHGEVAKAMEIIAEVVEDKHDPIQAHEDFSQEYALRKHHKQDNDDDYNLADEFSLESTAKPELSLVPVEEKKHEPITEDALPETVVEEPANEPILEVETESITENPEEILSEINDLVNAPEVKIEEIDEEPIPTVITKHQLTRLYNERFPQPTEIIPEALTKGFTSEATDDTMNIQLKGVMDSASKHHQGAEVTFTPTPSTIEKAYQTGSVSRTPEIV